MEGTTVNTSPELIALVQRDRERHLESERLARIVACTRGCCATSLGDRVAKALRLNPTTCQE
jgi:hypothetical protein